MAQQTAVDFLYEFVQMKLTNEQQMQFEGLFQQAKQMEKEQMENVWHDSRIEDFGDDYIGKQTSFNDYFNETFNTEDK